MDWQQIAALAIVALAFGWLLWSQLLRRGKQGGCASCNACGSSPASTRPLISADELTVLPSGQARSPQKQG
jgi:hypothetical protein